MKLQALQAHAAPKKWIKILVIITISRVYIGVLVHITLVLYFGSSYFLVALIKEGCDDIYEFGDAGNCAPKKPLLIKGYYDWIDFGY